MKRRLAAPLRMEFSPSVRFQVYEKVGFSHPTTLYYCGVDPMRPGECPLVHLVTANWSRRKWQVPN